MKRRTDSKLRLRDVTLQDIMRICVRYGIVMRWKIVPRWVSPWRLDRENRVWRREYGTDVSGIHTVERSLDAD